MFSGVLRPRHKSRGSLGLWGRLLRPSHLGLRGWGGDLALTIGTLLRAGRAAQEFRGSEEKLLGQPCMRMPGSDVGSPQRSEGVEDALPCLKHLHERRGE